MLAWVLGKQIDQAQSWLWHLGGSEPDPPFRKQESTINRGDLQHYLVNN